MILCVLLVHIVVLFIFSLGLFVQGASAETNCGHPGLPLGSEIVSKFGTNGYMHFII